MSKWVDPWDKGEEQIGPVLIQWDGIICHARCSRCGAMNAGPTQALRPAWRDHECDPDDVRFHRARQAHGN